MFKLAAQDEVFQTRVAAWHELLEKNQGKKFALYHHDSFEFACALFGAWSAGKILYLPGDALPATCAMLEEIVDGFIGDFPDVLVDTRCVNLPVGWTKEQCDVSTINISKYMQRFVHPTNSKKHAFIIYTSGSSGKPQAIPKKLSQLITEIETLEKLFGAILGDAEIIATVSHQHIYGLLFKILWPLMTGRTINIRSAVFLEEIADIINTKPCVLITSPAHLKRFPESHAAITHPNKLRAIFSSGAALPLATTHTVEKLLGCAPIEIYGSSEAGGIAWRQRKKSVLTDDGWQALPNVNWRINTDKILEIQSPHLFDDQWFRTHDHAQAFNDQHFLLQGRSDRIVKLEGKRISLDAIEQCLALSPMVSEVKVLMLENNNQRQRTAAVVVLNKDGKEKLQEIGKLKFNNLLHELLIGKIENIALPRSWRYVDKLPMNAQGKTTQAELQEVMNQDAINRVSTEIFIPEDLIYFDGHFPNAPILPGVVQIDWAIAHGSKHFDLPPFFRGMQALKFQNVIQPGMTVTLELQYDPIKFILAFRYYSLAGQHASGKILFGARHD